MSTVAIVMAAYNGDQYIVEQIDSILASSYQSFELYIYDDGSKDNTMSILRNYENQYPEKIHVFQNESNLGVSKNFLRAFCLTTADYVMFCDQDDVWKSNKIGISLKRIRNMEAQFGKQVPMAVFTDASVVDKDLKELYSSFFDSNHLEPKKTDLAHLLMENKLIGCTIMVNAAVRNVLKSSHYPQYAKFHDWWIALIAASFGKIGYVNETTLLYRQHGGNVVGGADFLSYFKNRITSLGRQREAIRILEKQAEEFLLLYGSQLEGDKKEIIRNFAELQRTGFIKKRIIIIKNGYLKSGLIRNAGLLLIV